MAKYRCRICHFVYNEKTEGIFFDDLFLDWTCPVCAAAKSEFERLDDEPEPPASVPSEPVRERQTLDDFRRTSDELETCMADIHRMALTGESVVEPMRSRKPVVSWDDILIIGAQLARLPLNRDETVDTKTVIGPRAKKPLVIGTPIIVSHMSFGALSKEAHAALALGSGAAGTATSSGRGRHPARSPGHGPQVHLRVRPQPLQRHPGEPRARRRDRDQIRPIGQTRHGRASPRGQGDRRHRRHPGLPRGDGYRQPVALPRHRHAGRPQAQGR